ncbi:hypothetical protein TNCV_2020261 [Trichonephila clavipes]|nr:hypothetical protein TNCV_2020261 [Trichonephila clavipes]
MTASASSSAVSETYVFKCNEMETCGSTCSLWLTNLKNFHASGCSRSVSSGLSGCQSLPYMFDPMPVSHIFLTGCRHVMSSSPVPLKAHRVEQRCPLNLSRAETSSRWCGVVVRRGGASSGVVHVT